MGKLQREKRDIAVRADGPGAEETMLDGLQTWAAQDAVLKGGILFYSLTLSEFRWMLVRSRSLEDCQD